jgi:uncharacterized protein (DUF427 family)
MGNSGPGYAKNPGHRVQIRAAGLRVRVIFAGEVVADTTDAVRLEETGYGPVYYLPREDVNPRHIEKTRHGSYCPYKGQASYFSLVAGGRRSENAAWSYEQPYDEVEAIRARLAFYPDRVDRIEASR